MPGPTHWAEIHPLCSVSQCMISGCLSKRRTHSLSALLQTLFEIRNSQMFTQFIPANVVAALDFIPCSCDGVSLLFCITEDRWKEIPKWKVLTIRSNPGFAIVCWTFWSCDGLNVCNWLIRTRPLGCARL